MHNTHHMMHGMDMNQCHCNRQFLTKEEKIEHFKKYKEWLINEQKGIEEAIQEL